MNPNKKIITALKEIANTGVINLNSIKNLSLEEQELIKSLHKDGLVNDALTFVNSMNVDNSWELFKKNLSIKEKTSTPLWKKAYKYAAVFVLILACSYFLNNKYNVTKTEVASDAIELILENGDRQILIINEETKIVRHNGKIIGSHKGNAINYNLNAVAENLIYNQLRVPYGKTFNLYLSDGTKAKLRYNIKIPCKFY